MRYRYRTIEFDGIDIHLRTLRDRQQFHDAGGRAEALGICDASWPIAGMLWESAEVLATIMLHFQVAGMRILELGCGLGLTSLVLNSRRADITATDYHPESESNLRWNSHLNGGAEIPFFLTHWRDACEGLGRFDLILGSDVLYERDHPALLAGFINRHAAPAAQVILVDPARGYLGRFGRELGSYGFGQTDTGLGRDVTQALGYRGAVRSFSRAAEVTSH